jgi:hypothetical protein
MVEMLLPTLVEPMPPDASDTSMISFEQWKIAMRTYEKRMEARTRNSHRVYALLMRQCLQALQNCMEASKRWERINTGSNVMELLQLIQGCMIQCQTRQKPIHSLFDVETHVFHFKQKGLPNNDYYEKFKDLVTIAERLGSDIGAHHERLRAIAQDIALDPNFPTDVEMECARERAKDEYLAVMFLMSSDTNQFGDLIRGIENDYTHGSDTYPATLSAAYDYLVNYRTVPKPNQNDTNPELLFYNEAGTGHGQGRGGRGGGHSAGCSRGTPAGCGSGCGSGTSGDGGQPRAMQEQVHNQDGAANNDEDAVYLVDNLDNIEDYSPVVYSLYLDSDFLGYTSNYKKSIDRTILLDSCSTVNLIANKVLLLRNIRRVGTTMNI